MIDFASLYLHQYNNSGSRQWKGIFTGQYVCPKYTHTYFRVLRQLVSIIGAESPTFLKSIPNWGKLLCEDLGSSCGLGERDPHTKMWSGKRFLFRCTLYSDTMGFFLNGFHWIQRIQWRMTKSKNGIVTRDITQPATDTLPFIVIECAFPLLPLVRYPWWLTTVNRYNPRDSNGNIFVYHYL